MTVYAAIDRMRALTKANKPFRFSFMSYSATRQTTEGIIEVRNALLRKRGRIRYNSQAEIMEEYLDLDTHEPRHFYHCTLMTFNGEKLILE